MAYTVLPSDLAARYDANVLADLASDTGEPVASLATAPRILARISDAKGRVIAALNVANLYTADDLDLVSGDSLSYLKAMTCDIAMAMLATARPEKLGDKAVKDLLEATEAWLDLLRKGINVLNLPNKQDAGMASVQGPSVVDYQNLNLLPDRVHNFYPSRGSTLPRGRGGW